MTAVVGRRDELERIERFLSDAEQRCASLIFEGEAGIGKTTVWREALRLAESEGCERSPQDLPRRKRSSASPRSRTSWRRSTRSSSASFRSRRGAPWMSRFCERARAVGAPIHEPSQPGCWLFSRASRRSRLCSSQSTTCSGSTLRLRRQSRSRCAESTPTGPWVCSRRYGSSQVRRAKSRARAASLLPWRLRAARPAEPERALPPVPG